MSRCLPSGTVTLLFTDIEGSTRLLHELGPPGYADALSRHRGILRTAFSKHGGVEVDTQGDAFFWAFPEAPAACLAAREGQDCLASGPVKVRIGIHTGTPHVTEEGYVGSDVHEGARIAAAAHGGQVVLSKQTRDLIDLEVDDLGEHRLKDFDRPVWIFQLGPGSFPPLKTISNTNLPRPASPLIGRRRDLTELVAVIRAGTRLVTLTGPGGTGKTRLSLEAAADMVPGFPHGVFWVDLASLRDHRLLLNEVGRVLGARDDLGDHIGAREMLLVLDNFEQIVRAAPELSRLLSRCPNIRIMVTSRELLKIKGEREHPVPPLEPAEAVDLFCARSGHEPDADISELCRRLDHLPLAVELAAARTSVLAPRQILERLAKRLDLLKGGRDADPRQVTLRTTIEWSYDLLQEPEKRLFERLSVFRGGCTLEAAETVMDADLDVLQSVIEKSLVVHRNERFSMLETIRDFAAGRLAEQPDQTIVRQRHAEHFLALAEEAEPHLRSYSKGWLDRVGAEHGNIRAALTHLEATEQSQLLLRLTAAMIDFLALRGGG